MKLWAVLLPDMTWAVPLDAHTSGVPHLWLDRAEAFDVAQEARGALVELAFNNKADSLSDSWTKRWEAERNGEIQ